MEKPGGDEKSQKSGRDEQVGNGRHEERGNNSVAGRAGENQGAPLGQSQPKHHESEKKKSGRSKRFGRGLFGKMRKHASKQSGGNNSSQTGSVRAGSSVENSNADGVAQAKNQMRTSGQPNGHGSDRASNGSHSASNQLQNTGERQEGSGSKKRRRNNRSGKRSYKANQNGQLNGIRNLRAPVSPTPDVTFIQQEEEPWRAGAVPLPGAELPAAAPVPRGGRGARGNELYAALDLGTNNCRLFVAMALPGGRFRIVDGFSRIVRLGEGLAASGRLSDDAMQRAVGALRVCAQKLKNPNIRLSRLIATEACRRASNGVEFLQRVREETGLELEIANRETEARLAAVGCGALMDKRADGAVLFDIGGGSSELVLINKAKNRGKAISSQMAAWTSLPLGVVTLAEHHGGAEVTADVYENMVAEVRERIAEFPERKALDEIWHKQRVHLLGTSGTVTTLAGVHLKLPSYDRKKVDGIWLGRAQLDAVIQQLLNMTYEERAANPCIGRERADLVLAGCAILQAIRETWPCERLRVADRGLREGILTELMRADNAWDRARDKAWERAAERRRRKQTGSGSGFMQGEPGGDSSAHKDQKKAKGGRSGKGRKRRGNRGASPAPKHVSQDRPEGMT